jgi:hypothetical protein
MPIPSAPLPNYTIPQQPPPDLLGMAQKMGSLREMNQLLPLQIQEQQEKAKQAALATQQQQTALASQKAMMDAVANGELNKFAGVDTPDGSGFDAAGAYQHLLSMKVLPEQASQVVNSFQTIAKNNSEIRKNLGAASGDYLKNRAESHQQMGQDVAKVLDIKDPAKQQMALDTLKSEYARNPLPGIDANDSKLFQQADVGHLAAVAQVLKLDAAMDSYHAKLSKEQSEAAEAKQKVIPEGGGLSPEGQQKVNQDVAVATNPQIQAGKEAVSAAEGVARANTEAQAARGSNAALANVPPHLITPASEAANKAGSEYAQSLSVTDRLKAMMDDAKKGNVVAYQLIPQEGALQITTSQGVKRINMAEIQNYGGGSLWQRMQGHLGKALTGKSIPDSVLDDMSEMQDLMARGNRAKYENTLDTINQTFGAKFKPVEMKGLEPKAGAAEGQYPKDVTLPQGWSWTTHSDGRMGITDGKNFRPYNAK